MIILLFVRAVRNRSLLGRGVFGLRWSGEGVGSVRMWRLISWRGMGVFGR
jgi:hypothetical protein